MTINKSYLKSKTLWVALAMAIAPIFPEVQDLIVNNPEIIGAIVGSIFAALRVFSKKELVAPSKAE